MPYKNPQYSDCEDYHEEVNLKSSTDGRKRFNDDDNYKEEFYSEKITGEKSDIEKDFPSDLKQIAMGTTVHTSKEIETRLDAFDLINEKEEVYISNTIMDNFQNDIEEMLDPGDSRTENSECISSNKKKVPEIPTEPGNEESDTKLDDDDHLNEREEVYNSNNADNLEEERCEDTAGSVEPTTVKKKKGTSRKSKLNALDEIHSETQRMVRQSRVSLPYHRPKQRSLADFLNRRKLVSVPLKGAQEKLLEVWQQVEEREKLAEKFYNSESDESEDESVKSIIENQKMTNSTVDFKVDQKGKNPVINNISGIPENDFSNVSFKKETGKNDPSDPIFDRLAEVPTRKLSQIGNYSPDILSNVEETDIWCSQNLIKISTQDNSFSKIASSDEETDICCSQNLVKISTQHSRFRKTASSDEETDICCSQNLVKISTQHSRFSKIASSVDIFANSNKEKSETPNVSVVATTAVEQKDTNENVSFLIEKLNKIPEINCNTPKISGSSDDIIVFDETSPTTGTLDLKKRFMKHTILKGKNEEKTEQMSVLSSEVNDKGEIIKLKEENIIVNKEEVPPKLGKKLVVLKATLQQQMAQLREQQLAKRVQYYKLYEDEIEPEDKLEVEKDEEEEEEFSESETESESEEELIEERKEKKVRNPFVDDEAEVSQDEDMESGDNTTTCEGDEDSLEEQKPTKLIRFDNDYMLKNQRRIDYFSDFQNEDSVDNLLELCSGNFTSQALNLKDLEATEASESQDMELQIADEQLKNTSSKESDSEEEFVVQKYKTKLKKLYISDDEEDEIENTCSDKIATHDENDHQLSEKEEASIIGEIDELASDDEEHAQENEDMEEDEEDELARKISKEFLDGEAELSGSDWESADEDERYLDELENELGDEDKISERKLQRELGKIHFKEVMAEDKREVRLLQELLLEDGELHSDGPKRQRIFRWYNDDNDNRNPDKYIDGDESEINLVGDEDDETWRKTRLEREKFLREKNIDNLEDIPNNQTILPLETGKPIKSQPKLSQTVLKSPDPKQQFRLISKRGSFLNRSEKVLNKLAQISTNTGLNENPLGSSKGKKNMVFAVISPPKMEEEPKAETLKRKSDMLITAPVKKLRFSTDVNVRKEISFLEKLKDSDNF